MAKRVSSRKRGGFRHSGKPPLHIVSDFGSKQMHTRSRVGSKGHRNKNTISKGGFHAK